MVGLGVENLSLANIPDVTEASIASVSRNSSTSSGSSSARKKELSTPTKEDECCDSITELPSQSLTLQHLVKGISSILVAFVIFLLANIVSFSF